MSHVEPVWSKLENVSRQLQQRGEAELAQEIDEAIAELRHGQVAEPPGGVMTTGEAAEALGVRSINTIKRWVAEGSLDGYRRGGRILVSRQSVERLRQSPTVAQQRTREEQLAADLEPFDFCEVGEEDVPRAPWVGRKPWSGSADAES